MFHHDQAVRHHEQGFFADNRRRVREDFALFFGYMFNTWSDFPKVCVSDKSLDLRWNVPFEKITRLSDDNIRDCAVKNVKGVSADTWNNTVYGRMLGLKSLRLLVAHEVVMEKGEGTDRKTYGGAQGEVRLYRRWLSMIVPAAMLFMGWAVMPASMPVHKALRFHPKSMHVLYSVEMVLRDVFDLHPARAIRNGLKRSDKPSGRKFEGDQEQQELLKSFFQTLMPGKSLLERATDTATMKVDQELYEKDHLPTKAEADASRSSPSCGGSIRKGSARTPSGEMRPDSGNDDGRVAHADNATDDNAETGEPRPTRARRGNVQRAFESGNSLV